MTGRSDNNRRPRKRKDRGVKVLDVGANGGPNTDDLEMGNIFTEDKNKMELLLNLNSIKLLNISEQFNLYPEGEVLCNEFIEIMKQSLSDSRISQRDDFIQQLVDLFFRCKKTTSNKLKFE